MRIVKAFQLALAIFVVLIHEPPVIASDAEQLVGRHVIVCRENAAIYKEPTADSQLPNLSPLALVTRIREVRGEWLRADEGWFLAEDVVDIDRAREFFTKIIETSPSGFAYASRSWAMLCLGSLADALDDAERAVARDPQCAIAFYARGMCKHKQKSFQEALDDFARAIGLEPRFKIAYNDRAISAGRLGRDADAMDCINAALSRWPDDPMLVATRGAIYNASGEYDKAINDFISARQVKPSQAIDSSLAYSYRKRGFGRVRLAQYELGIADLTEAIRLEPRVADAHMHRGEACLVLGQYEAAADDLREAVRLQPDLAEAHAMLGQALAGLGKLDDAIRQFNESIRLDGGKDPIALAWRGRVLHRRGKYAAAARDLEHAIKLNSNAAFMHSNLGDSLIELGDSDRAIEAYGRAIDLDPKAPEWLRSEWLRKRGFALGLKALATRIQEDFDRAIADCSAAIELDPTSEYGYLTRGHVFSLEERHDQAVADFTEAIAINPLVTVAYEDRADEWLKLHEPARAINDLTELLRISPNRPEVYLQRSKAWSLAGNQKQAAEDAAEAERIEAKLAESAKDEQRR